MEYVRIEYDIRNAYIVFTNTANEQNVLNTNHIMGDVKENTRASLPAGIRYYNNKII